MPRLSSCAGFAFCRQQLAVESKRFVKVGMDLLTPAHDSKEKLPLYYMQIKQLDTFSMGIVTRLQDEGTNKGSYRVCSNNYLYYRHPSRKKQNFMICAELGAESATCSVQCFISRYCNHLIVMLII